MPVRRRAVRRYKPKYLLFALLAAVTAVACAAAGRLAHVFVFFAVFIDIGHRGAGVYNLAHALFYLDGLVCLALGL